jgi:two-component system, OmpR family, phosphate regulon sensor histidine kinase PhoR
MSPTSPDRDTGPAERGGYRIAYHYLVYPIVIAVTLLSVTAINVRTLREAVYETHRRNLSTIVHVIQNSVLPELFTDEPRETPASPGPAAQLSRNTELRVTLIAADGTVLDDSHAAPSSMENHAGRPEVRQALQGIRGSSIRYSNTVNQAQVYAALPVRPDGSTRSGSSDGIVGVVRASYVVDDIDALLEHLYRQLLVPGSILLVAALAAAVLFSRSIRLPLKRLHRAAAAFAGGDLTHPVHPSGPRELNELAAAFASMARELQRRIRQLDDQRRETEEVLNTIQDPLFIVDSNRRIQRMNDAATLFFSVSPEDAAGRFLLDVFRNARLDDFVKEIQQNRGTGEVLITTMMPRERHISVWGRHLTSETSLLRGQTLLVLRDVTREHRTDQIRKDFVSNVSHELKTPLTMIQGAVETLAEIGPDEEAERRRFQEMITGHSRRMAAIVEDLLTLARIEQNDSDVDLAPADIEDLLSRSVSAILRDDTAVEVTVEPGLVWPVQESLLGLAVSNLVDNAQRYGTSGEPITVGATTLSGTLEISVRDRGQGIPVAEQERIFERFYRVDRGRSRHTGGTGLGLSIVRHVARIHGGTASVTSSPGRGSTFTITIPDGTANGGNL